MQNRFSYLIKIIIIIFIVSFMFYHREVIFELIIQFYSFCKYFFYTHLWKDPTRIWYESIAAYKGYHNKERSLTPNEKLEFRDLKFKHFFNLIVKDFTRKPTKPEIPLVPSRTFFADFLKNFRSKDEPSEKTDK